jgi:hypothetical protein
MAPFELKARHVCLSIGPFALDRIIGFQCFGVVVIVLYGHLTSNINFSQCSKSDLDQR